MTMNTTMKMEDNITMPSGSPNQALNLANKHLISRANFGTSTMIAKSLKILFLKSLKNATLDKPSGLMQIPIVMRKDSVKNLGHGIENLMLALNRKAPLLEVSNIVHA
jgi:hypothetical protein